MSEFVCWRSLEGPDFATDDTRPQYLPDTVFDVEHVQLDLDVDLEKRVLQGTCRNTIRILSDQVQEVRFDAVDLEILGAEVSPEGSAPVKAKFVSDGKQVIVRLPRPARRDTRWIATLRYRAVDPKAGWRFVYPDETYPDRPVQAWTQGQSDDARCWFPCRDVPAEKATAEISITVPEGYRAVSNGILARETSENGKATYTWRMEQPHSIYLFSVAIGRFDEVREPYKDVPILYYCERGRGEDVRRGFGKTPAAMEFFQREIGVPYPYGKYSQVAAHDFGGGMENTSATTNTDLALIDARAAIDMDFDSLVAHELAHQWFGDLVTCKTWTDAWLNESFATFYANLFQGHDKGLDEYRYRIWQDAETYFAEASEQYRRPIVTRQWRESFHMFDAHLYPKGGCVLHFFRSLLGEEAWRRGIRHYLETHRFGSVETRDLIEGIREATGANLEPQFEQWVFREGHPEFRLSYAWNAGRREAAVWIAQKQALKNGKALYEIPVAFGFLTAKGREVRRVRLSKVEETFAFRLPSEPKAVLFDPDSELPLKKVEFPKPSTMWEAQLSDENVLQRIEAVQELARGRSDRAVEVLSGYLKREPYWGARAEAARALGKMRTPAALELLRRAAESKHPKVRRAVIQALGEFRAPALAPLFESVFRRDPSYLVSAEALRALAATRHPSARRAIARALETDSWNETIRTAAVDAIAEFEGKAASLERFLKPGTPPQIKAAAIRHLARLGKGDASTARRIESFLDDRSRAVPIQALRSLAELGDPTVVPSLRKRCREARNSLLRAMLDRTVRAIRLGKTDDPPAPAASSADGRNVSANGELRPRRPAVARK